MKKRILPVFLCVCLTAVMLPAAVFSADRPSYLALGDSITTGYAPGGVRVEKTFADQTAERNGCELTNLAADGETARSLLEKLKGSQENAAAAQAVGEALPGADLITITVGGNDLMAALYGFLTDQYNEGKVQERQITVDQLMEALQNPSGNLLFLYGIIGFLDDFDGSAAETEALDLYAADLNGILTAVREKNPSAKIVLINQYNPYSHISDGGTGIVEAFESGVKKLNEKTEEVCRSQGAVVADIYTVFRTAGNVLCNAYFNGVQDFDLDFHPNQDGHDAIADVLCGLLEDWSQQGGSLPFVDVQETDWFYNAIDYVFRNELMNGTSADTFTPEGTTSRGMIVTVLWRMENQPQADYGMQFDDTSGDAYYAAAVRWAAEEEIVSGYGDGRFGPDDPVTREQLTAILYRYAQYRKYDVTVEGESGIRSCIDFERISGYAVPAMEWAWEEGIVQGTGDGSTLSPQGTATRAQTAAMLMRFCEDAA